MKNKDIKVKQWLIIDKNGVKSIEKKEPSINELSVGEILMLLVVDIEELICKQPIYIKAEIIYLNEKNKLDFDFIHKEKIINKDK